MHCCPRAQRSRDWAAKRSPTGLPGGCTASLGTLPHTNSKLTSTSWPRIPPWGEVRRSWITFHEPLSLPGPSCLPP